MSRREARERREQESAAAIAALIATDDPAPVAAEPSPAATVLAAVDAAVVDAAVVDPAAAVAPPTIDAAPPMRPRRASARRAPRRAPRRAAARPVGRRESVLPSMAKPKISGRALLTKLMSFSAMVGVAGILVATSVPANAFFSGVPQDAGLQSQQSVQSNIEAQSIGVTDVPEAAKTHARDSYTVVSLTEQLRGKYDTAAFLFTNNPNGTIQWPFATGVPISSGYGERVACSYCSSNHLGVDFVPGLGAPIQAIADGVVREVNIGGSAYGVNVIIDHEINGQKVTSLYAHMQWGSPAVAAGQAITVGQYLGDVGNTGASTGPHLHLEIHVNDKPVDPFVWLKANAN
ncbi:M23 family metallopeptidase [Homoserinimonas sp. A520]